MLKYSARDFVKNLSKEKYSGFYLGADVGGTFTRCTVAGIQDEKPYLIFVLEFETSSIESIIPAIKETLDYADKKYHINIRAACIGLAGVISNSEDFVKLTNAKWSISKKEIVDKTYLKDVFLVNDFEALGYGINFLDRNNNEDIFKIRVTTYPNLETKAVIGAGTGLGKCILNYHKDTGRYVPIASEGGNSDFPLYDDFEAELVSYIKEFRSISKPLVYEELLSGRGLEVIYEFLCKKKDDEKKYTTAESISNHRCDDEICRKTFELFSKFYGRCAKNFALDTLCKGGIYIAGGIATKNKKIFQSDNFIDEFNNGNRREDFLKSVPIYVITNPYTSLLGACYAASKKNIEDEVIYD
jgi:glucokinase